MTKTLIIRMLIVLLVGESVFSQHNRNAAQITPKVEVKKTTCFNTSSELTELNHRADIGDVIIMVSHMGANEKVDRGRRRLNNARIFISGESDPVFGRSLDTIVAAEGNKTVGEGYLDFFVKGQLELRIFLPKNKDLLVSPCVKEPEEKPCSSKVERLLYPCKSKP